MMQPDLDYVSPDIQLECAAATPASDMFSFGQLVCALFSDTGRSLIQADHNVVAYTRQIDKVGYYSRLFHYKLKILPHLDLAVDTQDGLGSYAPLSRKRLIFFCRENS